jgi:asparagine synthase (glutamine-hydrolysing)
MHRFWQRPRPALTSPTSPTWKLAWGNLGSLTGATWRDSQLAVFLTDANAMASSPSQRYWAIGDVWLSDRTLLQRFQTGQQSDLALIAAAWEEWGPDTFSKLIGSFSVALWDRECCILWLGRDRVGAFTLYYTPNGSVRWVAPTLAALAPHRSNELDLVALRDYLGCAFVPGERTLWQQTRELRPGMTLTWPSGDRRFYWQPHEQITGFEEPIAWHGQRLRSQLEQIMPTYLPAGQPVGVFLSGGLDSSCITALAAKFHDAPVHTYSIHFGAEHPNELAFSQQVAQHCQTQHHVLEIPLMDLWEHLPAAMAQLDDPIGDPLTVPNLLLGQLARQSVQVVLNGEGGDPCFGGPKNQPMLIHQIYGNPAPRAILESYLASFHKCAAELPQLLQPDVLQAVQMPWIFEDDLTSDMSFLNRLMVLNIKFKGADHILTKVNNLTRAAGVEGRSPLFDPRIVALSLEIPPQHKLSGVQEKAVLKQAVADLLPQEILHRPKSGMMVPVQYGFRQVWQRPARSLLLSKQAAIAPYLNQSLIREWLNFRGDVWGRYGVKLWLLVSLELWLRGER